MVSAFLKKECNNLLKLSFVVGLICISVQIHAQNDTIPEEIDTPLLDLLDDLESDSIAEAIDSMGIDKTPPPNLSSQPLFPVHTVKLDTNEIQYYYASNLGEIFTYTDTGNYHIQRYLPATRIPLEYATTGVPGGAAMPLFWEPYERRGLDLGFHQFDIYRLNSDNIKYFKTKKGFTHAKFSTGNEQSDIKLDLIFSKEFENGITFSLEHHRINQTSQTFRFLRQNHRHSDFQMGLAYNPEFSNYKSFLTYSSNFSDVQDNGGIVFENPEAERPFEETVSLSNAATLQRIKALQYTQYLGFFGKNNAGRNPRAYTLSHTINYSWSNYRYSDQGTFTNTDSLYYEAFPVDERGVRYYMAYNKLSNKVTIQTFRNRTKNSRDFLEVGAVFDNHSIEFDNGNLDRNNLFLLGRWDFQPRKFLALNTYGHFGLADNAGDYKVKGNLLLNFGEWGKLNALFINQLNEPSLLAETFSVNFQNTWNNDFKKILNTTFGGTLEIPKLGLTGGLTYHLVNNLVYYDSLGLPVQTGVPVNMLQIFVSSKLKLWKIHLENTIGLQTLSEDFLQLPQYFSRHLLAFQDDIFKDNLRFKVGFDGRIYSQYQPMEYFPLTGQFKQQRGFVAMAYPQIDFFMSMKVQKFTAFFNFENLLSYFGDSYMTDKFGQKYFYQLANSPYANRTFRWGISWLFSN
ncbi:MAG: putative porin [Saprospiraceae bacterium]